MLLLMILNHIILLQKSLLPLQFCVQEFLKLFSCSSCRCKFLFYHFGIILIQKVVRLCKCLRMRINLLNFLIVIMRRMNHQLVRNKHYSFGFYNNITGVIQIIQSHRNSSFNRVFQRNYSFVHQIILTARKQSRMLDCGISSSFGKIWVAVN